MKIIAIILGVVLYLIMWIVVSVGLARWAMNDDSDIEYIRADVLDDLITKSAVWFANRYQANGSYLCATDVEDYEKEIKEYIKQKWL